jgi:hypothetical protein
MPEIGFLRMENTPPSKSSLVLRKILLHFLVFDFRYIRKGVV